MKTVKVDDEEYVIPTTSGMVEVFENALSVANSNATILVRGETGTGKDVLAAIVHKASGRHGKFVKVNCAGIPEALLEAELYGHTKGAFTGATAPRRGKFSEANNGTIFLNEIGDMGTELQAKILDVLESGEVTPLGTNKPERFNARIVAATNVDIEGAIKQEKFREDLYHRLNVATLNLPTLRERRDDIPIFALYFTNRYSTQYGRPTSIDDKCLDFLKKVPYQWPGNIRELRDTIQRAILFYEDKKALAKLEEQLKGVQTPSSSNNGDGTKREITQSYLMKIEPFKSFFNPKEEDLNVKPLIPLVYQIMGKYDVDFPGAFEVIKRFVMVQIDKEQGYNHNRTAEFLKLSYKTILNAVNHSPEFPLSR